MRPPLETDTSFSFPILIGDIGGTNARFAILVDAYAEPKSFPIIATADFETIDAAIQAGVLDRTSVQPKTAILAVAGPIDGDEIDLTNCDWVVKPKAMISNLGFEDVVVINDFEAQALAVAFVEDEHRVKIGGGEIDERSSRVVLGPGTGLGVAGLVNCRHTWIPVPGEGGHVDMGPRSERDFEIFPHLEKIEGRISAEQLLCGRGLVNIYSALCAADGREAGPRDARRNHRGRARRIGSRGSRDGLAVRDLSGPHRRRPCAGLHGARRRLSGGRNLAKGPARRCSSRSSARISRTRHPTAP